jgi:hypothetical protein
MPLTISGRCSHALKHLAVHLYIALLFDRLRHGTKFMSFIYDVFKY